MQNTELKHTPGPWTVGKGTNGFCQTWQVQHQSELRYCTVADCGAIVNEVYQGSTENYVGQKINLENEANARLIACAPELLAALQGVLAMLELLNSPGTNDPIEARVYQARAAIAKATGGAEL